MYFIALLLQLCFVWPKDDHTLQAVRAATSPKKIAKLNTLQFYFPLKIAKFNTREIWLLIFREIE